MTRPEHGGSSKPSKTISASWFRAVAPAFALTALVMPSVIALFSTISLQRMLLQIGVTVGIASVALLFYRWRPMRLALHVALLCVPIELFYRTTYKGPVSPGVILSITGTSLRETAELLAGHPISSLLLIPFAGLALYAAVASWAAENPFTLRRCGIAAAVSVAFLLGFLLTANQQLSNTSKLSSIVADELKASFPIDIAYSLRIVTVGFIGTRRAAAARAHFSFHNVRVAGADSLPKNPEIYVIVIGEASRRINWSLFGYKRSTTPRLDAIRHDLILFDRMTSNATVTVLSIPLALTRATPASFGTANTEQSIIGLLRQGGFTVHWISNQERYGRNEDQISAIALEANSAVFLQDFSLSADETGLDSNLLRSLSALLQKSSGNGKLVIFLHTMGSHFQYRNRYPADFDKFHGFDNAHPQLPQWKMQMINEYDNSVYFTDYIVRDVIYQLAMRHCKAALLYFSDHGERLFDDGMSDGDLGHGFPSVARREIEIPFFLWLSSEYRHEYPELTSRLNANAHAAVELDSLFETLVDLTGLTYDGRNASASLFAENLRPLPRRDVLNMSEQRVFLAAEDGDAVRPCSPALETDVRSASPSCLQATSDGR